MRLMLTTVYCYYLIVLVELPGEGYTLDIDEIYVAGQGFREDTNYIGHMKNFFMDDRDFFRYINDLSSTPDGILIDNEGGHLGPESPLAVNSATFHYINNTFVTLQPLRIRPGFDFEFMVKTRKRDGLLFYNADAFSNDFFAVELIDGQIQFVVNDGSGPQLLRANSLQRLADNEWHFVKISALSTGGFNITVDEINTVLSMPNRGQTFSFSNELYVGGVPRHMYDSLPDSLSSKHSGGFHGCMASVRINKRLYHLVQDTLNEDHIVLDQCTGKWEIKRSPDLILVFR